MRYILIFLFIVVISFNVYAQADSLNQIFQDTTTIKAKRVKKPTVAITLSAVLPGAGQIYNEKYWKLPIFYTGLAYVGYSVRKSHWQYQAYRNDILLMQNDSIPDYLKFPTTGIKNLDELGNNYNVARRKRDLFVIGGVVVWILNVVDAYVDAELSDFDVSDDLSLNVKPYYQFNTFAPEPTYGLTFQLKF